ncbi:MAG: pseudouridine synthase [Spirochaetales bacterium]|nr:pseudouridine synthase [Spirochaetales bacterium]
MDAEKQIQIVIEPSKENPFVVIKKPRGLPSAPLFEGEECAFTQAAKLYPYLLEISGKKAIEHGLVHRIDTETEGLLLVAATQECYNAFINFQREGKFLKGYSAKCQKIKKMPEGFPPAEFLLENKSDGAKKYTVSSKFRPFSLKSAQVRPVTSSSGKAAQKKCIEKIYTTEIFMDTDKLFAKCSIKEGYRHQVRCHLAWLGFPVCGDKLYNPLCRQNEEMQFFADYLNFPHPLTGKIVECSYDTKVQ